MDPAVFSKDQCICSTDQSRTIRHNIGEAKNRFLVRYGDITANKARSWKGCNHFTQIGLRNVHRDIDPLNSVSLQPMGMQATGGF